MSTVIVILFLVSNCYALDRSATNLPGNGLHNYSEIHEAKSLIDALSSKLYLNIRKYQNKYENLRLQSNEYLAQTGSMQDQIKMLNKLKGILNDLTNKTNSVCEKFYSNFDFIGARKILIDSNVLLPKDYTVDLQVNHLDLINNDLALANGNDMRVYFHKKEEDCQLREIDRVLENAGTTRARVMFKLQEDFNKTIFEKSAYFLAYGNKAAGKAKENPENVYLFYDDFSNSNLEKKWKKNWGVVEVQNGALGLKTGSTPTGNSAEIAVFVKHGYEWEDIEVELDFNEHNFGSNLAPGPFLRVEDAGIESTTAWWFEYVSKSDSCTMRPFKNNVDGGWSYKSILTEPLSPGSWNHAKYRVVGESFSHWLNNQLVHDNVNVSSKWVIAKGTVGLGCHKGDGCRTFYDNIKIKRYVSASPFVSLGPECKVDLKKFHGFGTSKQNPAASCKQIHDASLLGGKLDNGVYWIKTSTGHSVQTYCDLTNGGWTLVGKVSGFVKKLYAFWLIKNRNVDALKSPALPSKVGCIDARYIATYHASTVMFASGDSQNSTGSRWVQWSLPQGRESDSLWTHRIGRDMVSKAKMYHVTVKAWNGNEQVCYQNKYGIMPFATHGGSYPSATLNTAGNTKVRDYCMSVGVQKKGTTADGWGQNGNGYDSPQSKSDWPNSAYNHQSPYVTVWLK